VRCGASFVGRNRRQPYCADWRQQRRNALPLIAPYAAFGALGGGVKGVGPLASGVGVLAGA